MKIIDNFLDPYYLRSLQKSIITRDFPWSACYEGVSEKNANDGIYFTHMFRFNHESLSDYISLLDPLLYKIPYDATEVSRIKGNLYPSSQRKIYHGWHSDYDDPHIGCIFYLNTNNGYTIFKNKKVKSVENRLLIFDPSIPHRSTTCTDANYRININFNYGIRPS